jgi:flavin reductase (DIM6/NTAB) family NADH-FMN oxidoreductase RutF
MQVDDITKIRGTSPHPMPSSTWVHLTEEKEFSRVLYPNPVCFLCSTYVPQETTAEASETKEHRLPAKPTHKNVMVLSWLTATNNRGNFVMSLNRHRYSACLLTGNKVFSLCVPIAGMEDLVLNVGSISGRISSKFARGKNESRSHNSATASPSTATATAMSKRQQKKLKWEQFAEEGIPGLLEIPFGNKTDSNSDRDDTDVFAIEGTVAHLKCEILRSPLPLENDDDDHYLLSAKVVDAYCHPDYWDGRKMIFRPKPGIEKSYLSFVGAQTFGQVVPIYSNRKNDTEN